MDIIIIGRAKEGKTTVATAIKGALESLGATVSVIDSGDAPRTIPSGDRPLRFLSIVVNTVTGFNRR